MYLNLHNIILGDFRDAGCPSCASHSCQKVKAKALFMNITVVHSCVGRLSRCTDLKGGTNGIVCVNVWIGYVPAKSINASFTNVTQLARAPRPNLKKVVYSNRKVEENKLLEVFY